MKTEAIERALQVVLQEMGAKDAFLRFGGAPDDTPDTVSVQTPAGFSLVAVFAEALADKGSATLRLRQLADSFFEMGLPLPTARRDAEKHLAQRRLDDELSALAGRTKAEGATVIDMNSPVLWGCSEIRREDEGLEAYLHIAELDRQTKEKGLDLSVISGLAEGDRATALEPLPAEVRGAVRRLCDHLASHSLKVRRRTLLHAHALSDVRAWTSGLKERDPSVRRLVHGEELAYFARSFAGIYVLIVYFPGPFSELHVEGAALQSLPLIERHVLGLPPVDPPPAGGKVFRMPLPKN